MALDRGRWNPGPSEIGRSYHHCRRECEDGSPCLRTVPFPWLACHLHDDDAPRLFPGDAGSPPYSSD